MRTYAKAPCPFCGKQVSRSGLATYSHRMAHVRKGEAVAVRDLGSAEVFFYTPEVGEDRLRYVGTVRVEG